MERRRFLQLAASVAAAAVVNHASGWCARADDFNQEVFLAACHWGPLGGPLGEPLGEPLAWLPGGGDRNVAYRYAGFRDSLSQPSKPVSVRVGERVLFHFFNASATEDVLLHLPGHCFTVVALDGNPVPRCAAVEVVSLTVGERVDAVVEMNAAGNWLLGSVDRDERARGLGVAITYADQNGLAQWQSPSAVDWSYARFSAAHSPADPDRRIEMLLEERADGSRHWIIDGRPCPTIELPMLEPGRRYRLRMMNATSRSYPVHLHGHDFELTRVHQIPLAGIFKNTIRLERYNVIEADVVLARPQRLIMDCGYRQPLLG